MTRQGKHHTVRSDLTGLTLLIITTKQSITFYGKMYGKVQYRTPIPSHVPVKVNTVTCAGKGFVTPNKHDELPHSFYSTTDNNNYQQWTFPSQEIEQPWKENIKTNESEVVSAVDPNFTEEEIAQERMKILTSIKKI